MLEELLWATLCSQQTDYKIAGPDQRILVAMVA
jgi:hypothetical protein